MEKPAKDPLRFQRSGNILAKGETGKESMVLNDLLIFLDKWLDRFILRIKIFFLSFFVSAPKNFWDCLYQIKWFFTGKPKRPDFSKEPMEMIAVHESEVGTDKAQDMLMPIFINHNPLDSIRRKWFENYFEYKFLAALEFCRRYPNHNYAKRCGFKKDFDLTDKMIKEMAMGIRKFKIRMENNNLKISWQK